MKGCMVVVLVPVGLEIILNLRWRNTSLHVAQCRGISVN
jgi:hypothetical protein